MPKRVSKKAVVRATSSTGGQKEIKLEQYSLIPVVPLREIARVYGHGASKYAPNNWRLGYPFAWTLDSLGRHIESFKEGEDINPETGIHHLAHAAFHLNSLMDWTLTPGYEKFDDRWKKGKK